MRNKLICALLAGVLLLPTLLFTVSAEPEAVPLFAANNSAVAYCIDTEQILYENKAGDTHAPGVTAKLMALMVAYDLAESTGRKLSERVTVRGEWVRDTYIPGDRSSPYLGLAEGDECTLEYLFACSLVSNANDACAALVGYCATELMAGTREDFLERMNQKAESLGMEDTRYTDPIGFGGTGKTTAYDVVKLTKAFYLYDELVKLADRDAYRGAGSTIRNKNYLECDYLMKGYLMEEAMGLIAGHTTNQGGYHLITFTEKEGIAYAFVVMGGSRERQEEDGSRWFDPGNAYDDMHGMVPYVLDSFTYQCLCVGQGESAVTFLADLRLGGGAEAGILRLVPAETVELMVANPTGAEIQTVLRYDEKVYESEKAGKIYMTVDAPVKQGEVLGTATFVLGGETLATVDMIAEKSVEVNTLLSAKDHLFSFLFEGAMGNIIKWVLIIIAAWIVLAILLWLARLILRLVVWGQDKKNMNKM
ncbi:MAG: D-alanyl-D-alanine carboxypeptidase [Ruminococcaceae bacterium]|nr:D-alanyl-D-alanine carboxypeptidase [Oscillospiraceae bacterium]